MRHSFFVSAIMSSSKPIESSLLKQLFAKNLTQHGLLCFVYFVFEKLIPFQKNSIESIASQMKDTVALLKHHNLVQFIVKCKDCFSNEIVSKKKEFF